MRHVALAVVAMIASAFPCAASDEVLCTPATSETKPFICAPFDAFPKPQGRTAILATNHWRGVSLLMPNSRAVSSARNVGIRIVGVTTLPPMATVSITTADHAWTWNESGHDLANLRTLRLAPGYYKLSVKAEGFEAAFATIDVTTANADVGMIAMAEQRIASGRVTDAATHSPLPGATVSANRVIIATADAEGKFTAPIARDVKEITVAYPERADAIVGVADGTVAALQVALSRAASLHVTIDRKLLPKRAVTITLLKERDDEHWKNAAERTLAARETDVVFDRIHAGTYRLSMRGDAPLAFASTEAFDLAPAEHGDRVVRISPAHLSLLVSLGETPLSAATVELTNTESAMNGALTLDDAGRADSEVWQPGLVLAAVRSPLLRAPHVVYRKLDSDPELSWHLSIPDLRVAGRIVDGRTHGGIRGAEVLLATKSSNGGTTVMQSTGENGEFEFRGIVPGVQSLDVTAEGYLKHAPVEFTLADNENRKIEVDLQSGAQREVRVKGPSGAAIPNASVLTVVAGEVVSAVSADAAGVANVPLPESSSSLLIAAAPRGSFGLLRLSASGDASAEPVDIIVPDGTATLRLTAHTTSDEPVSGVGFIVRFDGELIPFDALTPAHLDRLMTDKRGESAASLLPPGEYELWPYETPDEALLIAQSPPAPVVRLTVHPGINETSLKFAPR